MGCLGYICNGCNTQIVGNCFTGGELAILQHIRHGEVLGRVVGYYNEYGTVVGQDEQTGYRGDQKDLPNSHRNIFDSEFGMNDSFDYEEKRIFEGEEVSWSNFTFKNLMRCFDEADERGYFTRKSHEQMREEFESLPLAEKHVPRSGTEAWHWKCYCHATDEQKRAHTISKSDPDQSWGEVRSKYRGEIPTEEQIAKVVVE